jgi:Ca-activated chloride channel family protein
MLDSRIELTVRGPIVEAVIVQTFQNKGDRATEATYIFPLPPEAAVSAMQIEIGTRTIHATIEKRAEAQARYEEAVRKGVGAAVLDQERPDIFTQTVSAIPAKGTVEVTLRFDFLAWYRSGQWELVLPLVVAPRYVPGTATSRPTTGTGRAPDTDRAPDGSRITPNAAPGAGGTSTIAISWASTVTDVTSPTHDLTVKGQAASATDKKTDHDVVVRWKSNDTTAGWVESGYAAALVEAPAATVTTKAQRWTLILDRSAASRGDADAVAHPLVRALLTPVTKGDRVAVVGSDEISAAAPAEVAKTLEGNWSSSPGAFDLAAELEAARPDGATAMILVSGGLVADDAAVIKAGKALKVPIHVIGVGPSPARSLLSQLATATGGTLRFAVPGDDVAVIAQQVLADVATPPAPLKVSWGTLGASDIVPGTLPRLGAGQAMLVLAKVKKSQAANARAHGEVIAMEVLPAPASVDGSTSKLGPLGRRWARAKLDELLVGNATEAAVTRHALAYGLVSPYTSMVAIGEEVIVEGGVKRSVSVPVSVPAGMKWQAVKEETTIEQTSPGNVDGDVTRRGEKADVGEDYDLDEEELVGADASEMSPPMSPVDDAARTFAGSMAESTSIVAMSGGRTRAWLSLGGGYASTDEVGGAHLAVGARIDLGGWRTRYGLDANVWLADVGEDLVFESRVLATVQRMGLTYLLRDVDIGAGAGIHLGNGTGPAAAAWLRYRLDHDPVIGLFLRYDFAYLLDDEDRVQNGVTLGIEIGF